MGEINGLGNLNRQGIRSLRSGAAKAREAEAGVVQRFSVEDLKNGGSLNLGGTLAGAGTAENEGRNSAEPTIRQRYRGKGPAPSARRAQNSRLSPEEQVEKLSKIRKSAIEYEAVFVDHLVKQMRQSPLAKTPGGETFNDIAEQPFRDFLSQAGGLGLADSIVGQVARQEGLEETLAANPGIMGPNWQPKIPPNLMKKEPRGLSMSPAGESPAEPETGKTIDSRPVGRAEKFSGPDLNAIPVIGPRPAAGPESGGKAQSGPAGQMGAEEAAWLYRDASEDEA